MHEYKDYKRLIYSVCRSYSNLLNFNTFDTFDDILTEGKIVFFETLQIFDDDSNQKFSTFLYMRLKNYFNKTYKSLIKKELNTCSYDDLKLYENDFNFDYVFINDELKELIKTITFMPNELLNMRKYGHLTAKDIQQYYKKHKNVSVKKFYTLWKELKNIKL